MRLLEVEKAAFLSQLYVLRENRYVEVFLVKSAVLAFLRVLETEKSGFLVYFEVVRQNRYVEIFSGKSAFLAYLGPGFCSRKSFLLLVNLSQKSYLSVLAASKRR